MIDRITSQLEGYSLGTTELISMLLSRLAALKYEVQDTDIFVIVFSVKKIENSIKNECNILQVPEGLYYLAIDWICAEFLLYKKQLGLLDGFDLETAIKTVQAGDTTVTYATESAITPEKRMDAFLSFLLNRGRSELICYRRLKW